MAQTFLVLRTNDTSPQLYFHDGQNIDPTGLGALPGAALEDIATAVAGNRDNVKHNNRAFTFLDKVFVIQDSKIYVSTDEGATFLLDFTFTGVGANSEEVHMLAPIPVMVSGSLKLIGFYASGADNYVFEYDVATDTWTDADTGTNNTGLNPSGMTIPVVYQGLVYARVGTSFIAYDPISTGTVLLTDGGVTNVGQDQMLVWNGNLYVGPVSDGLVTAGMALLQGGGFDLDVGGINLGITAPGTSAKTAVFIDPNTGNLIVFVVQAAGALSALRVTPGLVVTDITGAVVGAGLAALGANPQARLWPHVSRAPSGTYSVEIYASAGGLTSDAVQRFTWVDDLTNLTEVGIVGGSGDMAFPYSIHGGDQYGFFPGEKRVFQTAQAVNATGITVTCEAYQQVGGTISVRGHYDKLGATANSLTLAPMTVGNPAGAGGLVLTGGNPGAQVDNVPANRTPITFDWDQVTDGFVTGDNYSYQLEGL